MSEDLNSYARSLLGDTQLASDSCPTAEMAFTSVVLEKIEGLNEYGDIVQEHCVLTKSNGSVVGEIHAYSLSPNEEVLNLFYADYHPSQEVCTLSNSDCQKFFSRMQGFYNNAIRGGYMDLDCDSTEYHAAKFIYDNVQKFQTVNLIVLSNHIINDASIKKTRIATKTVFPVVWDLKKIYGCTHSMSDHVAIDIDFESEEYSRYKIPFIQMESAQYGYKCVQAMFPAKLLFQLYERYNTNLLYNNVRYYIGLKGSKDKKPNVAMLDTLRRENEMFLAYNNGITALAQSIDSSIVGERTDVTDPDSKNNAQYITMGQLKKIVDFRIINGGQTTATIFNAKKLSDETKELTRKVNLLGVFVQVKLIISDNIEKISGNITRSSNFQNKMKLSDFTVGNDFNITMEKLSRETRVPSPNNDPTFWFYERLRGQYDEQRKQKHTKSDAQYFDYQFPKGRKFTKEEVAKVWTDWQLMPYDAVKGASTTYVNFMKRILEGGFLPDDVYYKKTIGLLILYKYLLARPENKQYTNGKATVVAYAIAMLSYVTAGSFDLEKVWQNQCVSDKTKAFLNQLCDRIYELLNTQAVNAKTSILSYGKSKPAFDFLKSQPMNVEIRLLNDDLN